MASPIPEAADSEAGRRRLVNRRSHEVREIEFGGVLQGGAA
jgi:hypothetical protein